MFNIPLTILQTLLKMSLIKILESYSQATCTLEVILDIKVNNTGITVNEIYIAL